MPACVWNNAWRDILGLPPPEKAGNVAIWPKHNKIHITCLHFLSGIKNYEKESSRGDKLNTCRISPYLHFGQISPRTVLNEGRYLKSPKFLRKLAWRDLSYWLLSVFPDLPYAPTRPQYQVSEQQFISYSFELTHFLFFYFYSLVKVSYDVLWLKDIFLLLHIIIYSGG